MSGVSGVNNKGPITVETPYEKEENLVSIDDFLQLMIAEMKNQDMFGGGEGGGGSSSSSYITQLAQVTTMQQMQQLAYYSKSNYVMSLVGKEITTATLGVGASVKKETGVVTKIGMVEGDFLVYVGDKSYTLSQIMSVNTTESVDNNILSSVKDSAVRLTKNSNTTAQLAWDAPLGADKEMQEKLMYKVYYSKEDTMNTVDSIKKGKLVDILENPEDLRIDIDGLDPSTTYYANVIVTGPDGEERAYKSVKFVTDDY